MPKNIRIPLTEEQQAALSEMLNVVPNKKVVQYDWTSESGRAFIKQVREIQISGVPLPWIAEALDVSEPTLAGAVGYWERTSATRGSSSNRRRREKRPLRTNRPEGSDDRPST